MKKIHLKNLNLISEVVKVNLLPPLTESLATSVTLLGLQHYLAPPHTKRPASRV